MADDKAQDTNASEETAAQEEKVEAKEEKKAAEKGTKNVSANLEKINASPAFGLASLSNPTLSRIIEQIEKLSVLELAELVHALEERFGVSASAPVAVGMPAAPAANGEPAEEKTTFNVVLSAAGENKIGVIKAVRELVPTLGLKEAKDLVEAAPKPVLEGVNKDTASEAKTKLTAAGATVELQ